MEMQMRLTDEKFRNLKTIGREYKNLKTLEKVMNKTLSMPLFKDMNTTGVIGDLASTGEHLRDMMVKKESQI